MISKLKPGDIVTMNNKYRFARQYRGMEFEVTHGVETVCGTECVWLKDFHGCYAADGLDKVVSGA